MIPAPLDSDEMQGERLMLEPAWRGKMPVNAVHLSDAWMVAAMQPKPQPDGSTLYTLTPPRDNAGPWLRVLAVAGFLAACVAAFTWPLWR